MAVPSYPRIHTTGPVHHYVRVPGDSNIYYLGTAEVTPKMQVQKFVADVFNDIGGQQVPVQQLDQRERATVGVMLNYFSKLAQAAILLAGAATGVRTRGGVGGKYSTGSLIFGQQTFELWQRFDFYGTAQATTGLEQGRYWPQVKLVNYDDDTVGTSGTKVLKVFDCTPKAVPRTSTTGGWQLVETADEYFPNDVQTPQLDGIV